MKAIEKENILIEQVEVKAKDHFKIMRGAYSLAEQLSQTYPAVAYLICVTHIEGLARLKYPKEKKSNKRFKKLVKHYGEQNEEFNKNYLPWLWKFYRCYLVHEWGILTIFFDNKSSQDYGILNWPDFPEQHIKKGSVYSKPKYIKTKKILEITKNCLDNLEKEFDPQENSKIIHTIKLKEPVEEELEYVP